MSLRALKAASRNHGILMVVMMGLMLEACVLVSCMCKVSLETRVVMPLSHFHCFVSVSLMELEGMLR